MRVYNADVVFDGKNLLSPGAVVVRDGTVEAVVPRHYAGPECEHAGRFITPGLVDPHTHCGVSPEGQAVSESDVNEFTDPLTPDLLALDSLDATDPAFRRALLGGVMAAMVLPGSSNVLGGQGCLVRVTLGGRAELVEERACLKCAISKFFYGQQKKAPATRMAVYAMLRQAFEESRKPAGEAPATGRSPGVSRIPESGKRAIQRVLRREVPLRVHLMTASEILATLRLAAEFDIRVVLDHATEAHFVAREIRERDVPVVYGPLFVPRDGRGRKWRKAQTAAFLIENGIRVALMTDNPIVPVEYLRLEAGLLIREGVPPQKALAAITSVAASIAGCSAPSGTIEAGKRADLVAWTGEPWQPGSRPSKLVSGPDEYVPDMTG